MSNISAFHLKVYRIKKPKLSAIESIIQYLYLAPTIFLLTQQVLLDTAFH